MWSPSLDNNNILAASSDVVRLYKYSEEDSKLQLNLTLNNKKSKYCAPLTSFDWNKENNSILGTASIDTTCTIWDLNKNTIRTQLIAHDKEVFDIAFSQHEHVFISTGADGSIRLFDLRSLDHSTIIYETKDQTPITKIAWNMQNSSFISALAYEKDTVYIIDSRVAMVSLVELKSHTAPVSSMAWAPQSNSHICSVGEDNFVLIWNIQSQLDNTNSGPILSYKAPSELSNVSWCNSHPEWIGVTFKNQVQLLKV
jgi:WD repeat-containing protein 68